MTTSHAATTLAGIGPLPQPDELTAPFWDACQQRRLVVQGCNACGTLQHPPEVICHACHGADLGWQEVAPTGTVYSAVNVTHPVYPGHAEIVPYNVVVVQIDGTEIRLLGNVLGATYEQIAIGAPVRLVWDTAGDDRLLPRWQLSG